MTRTEVMNGNILLLSNVFSVLLTRGARDESQVELGRVETFSITYTLFLLKTNNF